MEAKDRIALERNCAAHVRRLAWLGRMSAVALVLSTALASAQEPRQRAGGYLDNRYSVTVGVFALRPETTVRLDSPNGRFGTTLSMEDDLGLESSATAADLTFSARIGERHRVELEQFGIARSGERSNLRTIQVGRDTYDVGLQLDSEFDMDVTRLGYAYSFVRDTNKEVGIHVGVHVTDMAMRVTAALRPITESTQELANTTAPLPVIGAQGAYRFLPRWTMRGRAQFFRLAAGDYEGAINHVAIAFEHATFEHVGLGVALDYFEVDLDSDDTSFLGAFELKFTGPRLFAHMSF
ncbi:MAG TPA: hypothetical protein VGL98_15020 [Gammaproteobacteria bacterium]